MEVQVTFAEWNFAQGGKQGKNEGTASDRMIAKDGEGRQLFFHVKIR